MLELDLRKLFVDIRRINRSAVGLDDLKSDFHQCCVKSALNRCIEYNVTVNKKRKTHEEVFFMVAGLRGICEDLIVLRYLNTLAKPIRNEYLVARFNLNTAQSIAAQRAFFRVNNPLQPVVGGGLNDEEMDARLAKARDRYRATTAKLGSARPDGPTVFEMASKVGLKSTYRFMYFLASNFVHFNPNALMRMGWSSKQPDAFGFSVRSMSPYYRSLAQFYGAILFIGFHATFSDTFVDETYIAAKVSDIEQYISSVHRWPEIVTFEEMNSKPPLFFMLHALREVMTNEGEPLPYAQLLTELKAPCG